MSEDVVFLCVPSELLGDGLLSGVPSAKKVPVLRGPVLTDVVTVISNTVGIASGLATIAVEREQIVALARQVIGLLRRHHEAAPEQADFSIEIRVPRGAAIEIKPLLASGDDERAARELADVAIRVRSG